MAMHAARANYMCELYMQQPLPLPAHYTPTRRTTTPLQANFRQYIFLIIDKQGKSM